MSIIVFLFIPVILIQGYPQDYVQNPGYVNQCIASCPRSCSPDCTPTCCNANLNSVCVAGCPDACAPLCTKECCMGNKRTPKAKANPENMMITSVEEGETEEVQDKGFTSPTDNSADPPGTITIPLPPTMYVPPKPGEAPKELPLPDFNLPPELFQGKLPKTSLTLNPEKTATGGACVGNVVNESPPTGLIPPAAVSPPLASPPLSKPCSLAVEPPAPAPPALLTPPPPPPVISSGNSLHYPKLPPVTVSEIPNRVNRLPPLLLPKPKAIVSPPMASLSLAAKPPPIHINAPPAPVAMMNSPISVGETPIQTGGAGFTGGAGLTGAPALSGGPGIAASTLLPGVGLTGAAGLSGAAGIHPAETIHPVDSLIAQKMADELHTACGARCGVSYGKVPGKA